MFKSYIDIAQGSLIRYFSLSWSLTLLKYTKLF